MTAKGKKKCKSLKVNGASCGAYAVDGSDFCATESHRDGTANAAGMAKQKARAEAEEAQLEAERQAMIADLEIDRLRMRKSGEDPAVVLKRCEEVFVRWLGETYDLGSLHATLATVAVERLTGTPVWLLVVSGSGNAKTETVIAAAGAGAYIESSISGEAALLSATPEKEIQAGATGGLLVKVGKRGIIVFKDFTTILTMSRDARDAVLSALREVYDGEWTRTVGTGGGLTITWTGRLVLIGAVTTAWDSAHKVNASMGPRFVLVRTDSAGKEARRAAGRQAMANTGAEKQMQDELRGAFGEVIAAMDHTAVDLTKEEEDRILDAAELVTLARSEVERDYQGNPVIAHAPEAPTRFAKQLQQMVRGGVAIGMDRGDALRLAIRCARDSMPPLRLSLIDCLTEYASSDKAVIGVPFYVSDIAKTVELPWKTVDRELQSMHLLGLVGVTEHPYGENRNRWAYRLASDVDIATLRLG